MPPITKKSLHVVGPPSVKPVCWPHFHVSVASQVGVYTVTQIVWGGLLGSLGTFHAIDDHSTAYLRFLASQSGENCREDPLLRWMTVEMAHPTPGPQTHENLHKPILNLQGGSKSYEHKGDSSKTSLGITPNHFKLIPHCKAIFKKDSVSW